MGSLFQDVRYGLRMLRKSPAFTAVAVLTLALGIGANTAIFTVVNALLLKMLPIKAPQQLVLLGDPGMVGGRWNGTPSIDFFSYPLYREFRAKTTAFTGLAAAAAEDQIEINSDPRGAASSEVVDGRLVSGNYFPVLGVDAAAGRLLTESDDTQESANPVVVLSYGYWSRKFAHSPTIIGKEIRLNGYPYTVVGVAQQRFSGDIVGYDASVFVPLSMQPKIYRQEGIRNDPHVSWLSLIGRLRHGVSVTQAKANVNLVFQQALKGEYGGRLNADDHGEIDHAQISVGPGGAGFSQFREEYRAPLVLLMGIVGLVLLIACVNVANLLLARARRRSKEIAVRLAMGASQRRLLQQLLTESILLAFLGGICGALLSIWGVRLLIRLFVSDAAPLPLAPDLRVFSFTMTACLLTGILFGVVPALSALKVQVNPSLKDASVVSEPRSRIGWGKSLVAGQVALSLLVLFGATLLVRSLQKLMSQDLGYESNRIVVAHPGASAVGYKGERMKQLAQELSARLSTIPGVRGVSYSRNGLLGGGETADAIIVPGFTAANRDDRQAREDSVAPDYFATVGIPILLGRGINAQDTATSTRVAVINQAMMKHFFHGENPLGRQFEIDDPPEKGKPFTVIGVSKDAKDHGGFLRSSTPPRFYFAFQQDREPPRFVLEVVTHRDPNTVLTEIRTQIKAADANLPIYSLYSVRYLLERNLSNQIALARLSAFFAGLALLLAGVGLYGLMSYTVAGRTREIGIRLALGAQRKDVLNLVLHEGLLLIGIGLAVGIPLSLAGSRMLHSFLFGLKGTDPVSLAMVIALLGVVGAIAGFIPARRATKVNPVVALRYE